VVRVPGHNPVDPQGTAHPSKGDRSAHLTRLAGIQQTCLTNQTLWMLMQTRPPGHTKNSSNRRMSAWNSSSSRGYTLECDANISVNEVTHQEETELDEYKREESIKSVHIQPVQAHL
jgi:hypothetical protein